MLAEHRAGTDVAGWLSGVLVMIAAELGDPFALVDARPGSWEAAHVVELAMAATIDESFARGQRSRLAMLREASTRITPRDAELPAADSLTITAAACMRGAGADEAARRELDHAIDYALGAARARVIDAELARRSASE